MPALFRRIVARLAARLLRPGGVAGAGRAPEAGAWLGYESAQPHLQRIGQPSVRP